MLSLLYISNQNKLISIKNDKSNLWRVYRVFLLALLGRPGRALTSHDTSILIQFDPREKLIRKRKWLHRMGIFRTVLTG